MRIKHLLLSPNPSDLCRGFRKIPSEEFLGPKNPLDFFGGETELKTNQEFTTRQKSWISERPKNLLKDF